MAVEIPRLSQLETATQDDIAFAIDYERRLRALSQSDVTSAKPQLLEIVYSQKADARLRYSTALCLLRSGSPLTYEEMSRAAAVGYAISMARDQARANSLLFFFLSHLPKGAQAEDVQKTMATHGWSVDQATVAKSLSGLAGKKLPISFIE
jgi:hypothetical protein